MKTCLRSMGISEKDLEFRFSLIPVSSRKILERAWFNKENVELIQEQFDKAVEDLKKTRYLVVRTEMGEVLAFQEGYDDFTLAVSCAKLYKELFGRELYDKKTEDFYDALLEALRSLSDNERNVILMRYGFDDGNFYTLEETGKKYGITKSAVRARELRAIHKLRQHEVGLYHSREFYALDSTIRCEERTQVKAQTQLYLKALDDISIRALDMPKAMKEILAERGCDTLAKFLRFKQTDGLSDEMITAIKQMKLDFCQEMFDID